MSDIDDLLSVTDAAERAGVGRNTMLLAAKSNKIKAVQIGKAWFVYASDIERWKREAYRPDMAFRHPAKKQADEDTTS